MNFFYLAKSSNKKQEAGFLMRNHILNLTLNGTYMNIISGQKNVSYFFFLSRIVHSMPMKGVHFSLRSDELCEKRNNIMLNTTTTT